MWPPDVASGMDAVGLVPDSVKWSPQHWHSHIPHVCPSLARACLSRSRKLWTVRGMTVGHHQCQTAVNWGNVPHFNPLIKCHVSHQWHSQPWIFKVIMTDLCLCTCFYELIKKEAKTWTPGCKLIGGVLTSKALSKSVVIDLNLRNSTHKWGKLQCGVGND